MGVFVGLHNLPRCVREVYPHLSRIQINHLSTVLIALLLLPIMTRSKATDSSPRLTVVSSGLHHKITSKKGFPEASSTNIFEALNDQKTANMSTRYDLTKRKLRLPFSLLMNDIICSSQHSFCTRSRGTPSARHSARRRRCQSWLVQISGTGLAAKFSLMM